MSVQAPIPNQPKLFYTEHIPVDKNYTFGDLLSIAKQHEPASFYDTEARENLSWERMEMFSKNQFKPDLAPIYTINSDLTSFDPSSAEEWNMTQFSERQSVIHTMDRKDWFPGIHTPYSYVGMFGTNFPFHREDRYIFSMNFLHFGKPKLWYAIPHYHARKFEAAIQNNINNMSAKERRMRNLYCSLVVRHKNLLAPPSFLQYHDIDFGKVIQRPGEIIISLSGLHGGLNLGFNIAEALNFALDPWFFDMYHEFDYGQLIG